MSAGLEFREIAKTFRVEGRVAQALRGVSGRILPGQITGLVGPDGAGKTTLVRTLAGLIDADSGTVTITPTDKAARVGYMPQKFGLYEDLTVDENMVLYADLNGLPEAQRAQRFAELNRFTGLGPFGARLAGQLSGGMKQKLGLACTLIVAPDILLLDEPSVGVDPVSRRELWSMVRALQGTGIAVLWSTAYLDEADGCDSVILLYDGQVIDHGVPAQISAHVARRTWRAAMPADGGARKRDLQRAALELPGVVDAQIKGRNLRVVTAQDDQRPDFNASTFAPLRGMQLTATAPQFEDAYLAAMRKQSGDGVSPSPILMAAAQVAAVDKSQSQAVIETHNLSKRFGTFTAVDQFTFSVKPGEIFGLLGPNGAGKSTTFKMLCGLIAPTSGRALVAGFDLTTARADARSRIGYMAQKFAYVGHLTVEQNISFAGGVYGLSGAALKARAAAVVEEFGLSPYLNQNCGDLPLGIKQRMALACAVLHRPAILFLDEPTSGVDPVTRREFWARLNAMADDGTTILVTSHFLDEAEYCDRMAIIYRGRQIAAGSPDEIKAAVSSPEPTLEEAFIKLVEDYDAQHGEDQRTRAA